MFPIMTCHCGKPARVGCFNGVGTYWTECEDGHGRGPHAEAPCERRLFGEGPPNRFVSHEAGPPGTFARWPEQQEENDSPGAG